MPSQSQNLDPLVQDSSLCPALIHHCWLANHHHGLFTQLHPDHWFLSPGECLDFLTQPEIRKLKHLAIGKKSELLWEKGRPLETRHNQKFQRTYQGTGSLVSKDLTLSIHQLSELPNKILQPWMKGWHGKQLLNSKNWGWSWAMYIGHFLKNLIPTHNWPEVMFRELHKDFKRFPKVYFL